MKQCLPTLTATNPLLRIKTSSFVLCVGFLFSTFSTPCLCYFVFLRTLPILSARPDSVSQGEGCGDQILLQGARGHLHVYQLPSFHLSWFKPWCSWTYSIVTTSSSCDDPVGINPKGRLWETRGKGQWGGRISTGWELIISPLHNGEWGRNPMQSLCLCPKHLDGRSGTKDLLSREHRLREVAWISSLNQVIAPQCVSS